jgi:hypothetical protein
VITERGQNPEWAGRTIEKKGLNYISEAKVISLFLIIFANKRIHVKYVVMFRTKHHMAISSG